MMWGIVPAAGRASRIQPLGFSKELLPVGSRIKHGQERPCAVSEHLLDRMLAAGVDKICMVIAPGKSDILEYFGSSYRGCPLAYVVQPEPTGLCDSVFRAEPLIADGETVVVGLPDTIWFPIDGLTSLPRDCLAFMLFPVARPELFDAVLVDEGDHVREIRVKSADPGTEWVWGAFQMPADIFRQLVNLWRSRQPRDEYFGTLINAWLAGGGRAVGIKVGTAYADVGTLPGYRAALQLLAERDGRMDAHPENVLRRTMGEHGPVETA